MNKEQLAELNKPFSEAEIIALIDKTKASISFCVNEATKEMTLGKHITPGSPEFKEHIAKVQDAFRNRLEAELLDKFTPREWMFMIANIIEHDTVRKLAAESMMKSLFNF